MSLMKRKSNWPSINKWLKCFVKLATALFNLLRNITKDYTYSYLATNATI